ncbi:two component, sigma54 specific, transcriptional regulator, Fis family [Desulfuromusa kysingii]|uniref:Two component, sigma54 specific, transcriptional regulator, Fis family n=1 Tax=Desulfuromusa kysingii TaxID=37625 RepID=A0A1H4DJU1_9BACT|nr:sigma-54 dependent transcriptional regulator [Desulfuromusa kysingii]SEA72984.1 two component, sigma54 specific, transcriptional regulator, Fis family [Desulfuromusa kysingii]
MAKKYPLLPLLLVDDEPVWLHSLAVNLKLNVGINNLIECSDSRDVLELLDRQEIGLILLDLTMPHLSGEELLSLIVENHPAVPVIILSGLNQLETAVRCMRLGAFDYFVKTTEQERLLAGIRRALNHMELERENRTLKAQFMRHELQHPELFAAIITGNKHMRSIFQYIEAVAGSPEPVLITGESGVGKELVAKAVHQVSTPEGPWVAVNVAGLDDNTFADTLFGHTRGAYTGADSQRAGMIEKATSGTLFLDEIGDLSPTSQVKLLRLMQEGEYFPLGSDTAKRLQARVVFATNRDLAAMQSSGAFRKDLYYRLHAHHVQIPPLRERLEDLPLLLDFFLQKAADSLGKKKPTPPEELAVLLATYYFPGNIRELRSMVYDAVSLHQGRKLSMDSFKQAIGYGDGEPLEGSKQEIESASSTEFIFPERLPPLKQAADLWVAEALRRSQGNQNIAAQLLGISPQALSKRLKKQQS